MPHRPQPYHSRLLLTVGTGRWDKVESVAQEALQTDATNPFFHYYRGVALSQLDREHEALPHVEFLLKFEPTSAQNHHLAALVYAALKKPRVASKHIDIALGIDPEEALYHYDAARIAIQCHRTAEAEAHARTARRLDPDAPDFAHLDIALRSATGTGSAEAWKRVAEFEDALALDPENARLHDSLGDVYLKELEAYQLAEQHYRQAVASEPSNKCFQRDLFDAVSHRDPIYRTLSFPPRGFAFIGNLFSYFRTHPLHVLVAVVVGLLPLAFFAAWLTLAAVFFSPPAKLYEWLLIRQVRQTAGTSPARLRTWFRFRRLPLAARITTVLLLAGAYWTLLVGLLVSGYELIDASPTNALRIGITFFALHFIPVLVASCFRSFTAQKTRPRTQKKAPPGEGGAL